MAEPVIGETYRVYCADEGTFIIKVLGEASKLIEVEIIDPLDSTIQMPAGHVTSLVKSKLAFTPIREAV